MFYFRSFFSVCDLLNALFFKFLSCPKISIRKFRSTTTHLFRGWLEFATKIDWFFGSMRHQHEAQVFQNHKCVIVGLQKPIKLVLEIPEKFLTLSIIKSYIWKKNIWKPEINLGLLENAQNSPGDDRRHIWMQPWFWPKDVL